jgi:hypothetical protein
VELLLRQYKITLGKIDLKRKLFHPQIYLYFGFSSQFLSRFSFSGKNYQTDTVDKSLYIQRKKS